MLTPIQRFREAAPRILRQHISTPSRQRARPCVAPAGRNKAGSDSGRRNFVAGGLMLGLLLMVSPAAAQRLTLVSMKAAGSTGGSSDSLNASVSSNGRFVAFSSSAHDLVAMSVSVVPNIYVRDLHTGATTLVSINRAGKDGGNRSSTDPVISGDGRYVAFQSAASNLTANDTNNTKDVFVRDLQTGTTMLASAKLSGGDSGNGESFNPYISANGQVVTLAQRSSRRSITTRRQASPSVTPE